MLLLTIAAALCFSPAAPAQDDDRTGEAIELFNKGQDAHEKGDLGVALKLYDQALAIIPQFPEAELQRGNAFVALGRIGDAEKAFRRAVEIKGDWTIALAALGSVLVQKGSYSEAEPFLVKAIELDDQNFPAYAALSELRLKTNAKLDVLRDLLLKLRRLTDKVRPPASIWAARAAIELAIGETVTARQSIANALQLDPRSRYALYESVNIALAEKDPARAEEFVKRLENVAPDSEEAKVARAKLLLAQGKVVEGVEVLDSITNPGPETLRLKDVVRVDQSLDLNGLEARLRSEPNNAVILGRLCTGFRTKSPEKAAAYCRRALEAEPNNISHAIGFGAALVQARQFEDAVSVLSKLVSLAPDNATARANLATALFQLKRYEEAKNEYRWLVRNQPSLAAAYYFLAIIHDQLGEYIDAMANYQQFLRLADPAASKLEIEKVNLRLPALQKQLNERKVKKHG